MATKTLNRYLAPLNSDRFFKKVFSDTEIAKAFLQDFLNITIDEIQLLKRDNKITDSASEVRFDFRCLIDGRYVIIEMQQGYSAAMVKRFFTYHCLNTVLQLENLPEIEIPVTNKEIIKDKDYSYIEPAITLVWLAHNCMGFKDSYMASRMQPEQLLDFILNHPSWTTNDLAKIQAEREKILEILKKYKRHAGFLQKNRLIFIYQKNIVQLSTTPPYKHWFDFAEKTLQPNNKQADFEPYSTNPLFKKIMKRLEVSSLPEEDKIYIEDETEFQKKLDAYQQREQMLQLLEAEEFGRQDGMEKGRQEGRQEGMQKGRQEGRQEGMQKGRQEGMEIGELSKAVKTTVGLLNTNKFSVDETAELTELTTKQVRKIQSLLQLHGENLLSYLQKSDFKEVKA